MCLYQKYIQNILSCPTSQCFKLRQNYTVIIRIKQILYWPSKCLSDGEPGFCVLCDYCIVNIKSKLNYLAKLSYILCNLCLYIY